MTNLIDFEPLPTDESEAGKIIYAHFGLAIYKAQVLEHGILNALLYLDFLPEHIKNEHTQKS